MPTSDGGQMLMKQIGPLVVMEKQLRVLNRKDYSVHCNAEFLKSDTQAKEVDTAWKQKKSASIIQQEQMDQAAADPGRRRGKRARVEDEPSDASRQQGAGRGGSGRTGGRGGGRAGGRGGGRPPRGGGRPPPGGGRGRA
jgi:hypothetical protein